MDQRSAPSAKRPAAGATASSRSRPACDRGHAYCAVRCRTLARRRSVQAAQARHQRSREGRLDHRDHQRAYRARCRVRDLASPAVSRYARLHAPDAPPAPAPDPTRCLVCGRVSRWLIPVRWPRVDRRRSDDHARARAEIRRLYVGELPAALGVHAVLPGLDSEMPSTRHPRDARGWRSPVAIPARPCRSGGWCDVCGRRRTSTVVTLPGEQAQVDGAPLRAVGFVMVLGYSRRWTKRSRRPTAPRPCTPARGNAPDPRPPPRVLCGPAIS